MWANVENYTGEGSVSAFDDGNVFHSRTETRCRHIVVGADVMLVLAVNSCWIIFNVFTKHQFPAYCLFYKL